jgi:hypothetical protein
MTMSTQTLADASALLSGPHRDRLQILTVGTPVTMGTQVTRPLTPRGDVVPGLVQATTLENAIESQTSTTYSIKVSHGTGLVAGEAVRVVTCEREPALVGKTLLVDKVSLNGLALIRKATASDFDTVDQQGKGAL